MIAALIVSVSITGASAPLAVGSTIVARPSQDAEVVAAIQVHGNHLTSDDEIRRLASITIGAPVEEATIREVAARLRATKRFERVQVLKRFASIADPSQVLLVIIVDEGPVAVEMTGDPANPTRVVRRGRSTLMFLPILYREDGYAATYGGRFAWPTPAGKESRIAFPMTWGGDKRAAAEFDTMLKRGPIDRVTAGFSISRRINPYYQDDDSRTRAWIRGERLLRGSLRAGATVGWQRASFLGGDERFAHAGADVTFDTRVDPVLPRNAVFARAAWDHIAGANRLDLDARGYVAMVGQNILALRVERSDADRSLPPFLKPLLGGMPNLRGFSAGTAAGDKLVAVSAEVIAPLTSPTSMGRIGVTGFVDAGASYDHGQRLVNQQWRQGIGGSVWFSAAFLRLNVAVAHGRGSSTRVHVGASALF